MGGQDKRVSFKGEPAGPSIRQNTTSYTYTTDENDDEEEELQVQPEKVHSHISSRAAMFGGGVGNVRDQSIASANPTIIFPWTRTYKKFWFFTVVCSIFTVFFEPYMVAFEKAGLEPYANGSSITEYVLMGVFAVDIVVSFNLAYYNDDEELVYDRRLVAHKYLTTRFWRDFVGVFPFYSVLLAIFGELGSNSSKSQYLSLVRLVRLIRLHRVGLLFEILQYSTQISLFALTIVRNFAFSLVWAHFWACVMFFISRQYDHEPDETFLGGALHDLSKSEQYLTSLYFSVVTFTTVGYGDFSPVNAAEQIFGMSFMLLNLIFTAWSVGSITLLVLKNDEKTGAYRETINIVNEYARVNRFKGDLRKRLKMQLQLNFNNQEISDEFVLSNFPSSTRRRLLRQLYMSSLLRTTLLNGIRQQFLDQFIAACKVEIFGPGEELLHRGSIASELYLLVGGTVQLSSHADSMSMGTMRNILSSDQDSHPDSDTSSLHEKTTVGPGDFINEISFFTETPQIDTIRTSSICKTLTLSRAAYKTLSEDHPGTVCKVLKNLLAKVEMVAAEMEPSVQLPRSMSLLRAGSAFFRRSYGQSPEADARNAVASIQASHALSSVRDLVRMHIVKQNDDHTTRFLFAASRGDVKVIELMCDQGFSPNEADYDHRTALMIASMKGNTEVVSKLLSYEVTDVNMLDMHGSSALYEAVKNGHDDTMRVLLKRGASLCMDESLAASTLCQVVYNGDMVTLKRLLQTDIQVNAGDYDKRTALHIAAAEGNVVALKTLIEHGADVSVRDRWNNSLIEEAKRASGGHVLEYLESIAEGIPKE